MRIFSFVNIIVDYFLIVLSVYCSLWLRFNGDIPANYSHIFFYSVWFIALGKIIIYTLSGIYKIIIKFIHTYDVINILKANIFSTVFFSLIIFIFKSEEFLYPRSVVIIDFILSFSFITGLRFIEKFLLKPGIKTHKSKLNKVLIIGAGDAGSMVLRELRNHPESGMKCIGFIDDDKNKLNMSIGGKNVLGGREKIP